MNLTLTFTALRAFWCWQYTLMVALAVVFTVAWLLVTGQLASAGGYLFYTYEDRWGHTLARCYDYKVTRWTGSGWTTTYVNLHTHYGSSCR